MPYRRPAPTSLTTRRLVLTAAAWTLGVVTLVGFIIWNPGLAGSIAFVVVILGGILAFAVTGDVFTQQWRWSLESRRRIRNGAAEWFDLKHFLNRPRWRLRTTPAARQVLLHCARSYVDGGRGTNSAPVLLDWLRRGEDWHLLVTSLEHGVSDDRLRAHLSGEERLDI